MNKLIIYLLTLIPLSMFGQSDFSKDILDRLVGTQYEGKDYFQLGNYAIFSETVENDFSAKNLAKLKKKYGFAIKDAEFKNIDLNIEHTAISKSKNINDYLIENETYYFIKKNTQQIKVVAFLSNNYRDTLIEKGFVKLYWNNKIPDSIFISQSVENINFVGRKITISGKSCQLMNLRSLQCPYLGQMNWALHGNIGDAKQSIKTQFETTKNQKIGSIVEDEIIDVTFEGVPTKARKVKFKIKIPKFLMGGSNTLIIYYVAGEIRGKNLSCVLSHYDSDRLSPNGLPALLDEVMKLSKR